MEYRALLEIYMYNNEITSINKKKHVNIIKLIILKC